MKISPHAHHPTLIVFILLFSLSISCTAAPQMEKPINEEPTAPFYWTGQVHWSEEPLWPVTVSLRKKNNCDVITSVVVTSDAPFTISADLTPGDYQIYSELQDSTLPAIYWDAYGPAVTVPQDGEPTLTCPQEISHNKKMVPLFPMKEEVVSARRPTLQWEAVPHAALYRVFWFEKTAMEGDVIKTEQYLETEIPEYTFKEDIVPNRTYEWNVHAYKESEKGYFAYTPSCWFKTAPALSDE